MKTLRITAEILSNNNGDKASSSDIAEIQLSIPTTAAEVGLPRKEQLDIITKVQQIGAHSHFVGPSFHYQTA